MASNKIDAINTIVDRFDELTPEQQEKFTNYLRSTNQAHLLIRPPEPRDLLSLSKIPQSSPEIKTPYDSFAPMETVGNAMGEFWKQVNPTPVLRGMWDLASRPQDKEKSVWENFQDDTALLRNLLSGFVQPNNEQLQQGQTTGGAKGLALEALGQLHRVPIAGPVLSTLGGNVLEGEGGKAIGDLGAIGAQLWGPRLARNLTRETMGIAGKGIYREGLPMNKNLPLQSQAKIVDRAFNSGITARYGVNAEPELAKAQLLVDEGLGKVKGLTDASPVVLNTLPQLEKAIEMLGIYERAGATSQARGLLDGMVEFVQKHTAVPRDPGSFPIDASPLGYIHRATALDAGHPVSYWQGVKQAMGKIVRSADMQKSMSELAEASPSRSIFNDLTEKSMKSTIEHAVPEVGDWNTQVSQAIYLRDELEKLAKTKPKYYSGIMPWIVGAAAGGVAGAAGVQIGKLPLEMMGPIGLVATVPFIIRKAMSSPAVMTRLGLALANADKAALPGVVGNLPKVSLLDNEQLKR